MLSSKLDNVEEVDILEEAPKKVKIGKKFVLIRQMTIKEYLWLVRVLMQMYLKYSQEFINIYRLYTSSQEEKSKLKEMAKYMVILIKVDGFRKELMGILNKIFRPVGWHLPFCSSYLERHATINDILQLLFGVYQYNFADVKKNFLLMMESMGMQESMVSLNLKQSSKENSTGKKEKSIEPRFKRSTGISKSCKTMEM